MLPDRANGADTPSESSDGPETGSAAGAPARPARRHGGFGTPLPRWARIIIASVLLTTAAATLVTHVLLTQWNARTRLELDAVRAAADGAAFLPGAPARALDAAVESAELRGLSRPDVVHVDVAPDRMSLSVTLRCTTPSLMLRLLRSASVDATATVRVRRFAIPRRKSTGAGMDLSALLGISRSPHPAPRRQAT